MKRFEQWSIRAKLMLLVFIVAISIIVPISGGRLIWDYQQSRETLLHDVTSIGRLIADRSSASLIFDDARLAEENLDALGSMPNLHKGCIYLLDGALFAEHTKYSSRCEWDFKRIKIGDSERSIDKPDGNWFSSENLHVILPIQQGYNVLGHIYLVSDLSQVQNRMRQQITFSLFALFVVLLITGLITGWIRKLISGPVESLLVKYRSLFDYANDVILLSDAKTGEIIDINPEANKLYGYSRSDLLSMTLSDLSAPEKKLELTRFINKVNSDGEAVVENEHHDKHGHEIPVEISSRLVEIDDKQAILSIVRNLTERKKVEKALGESEIRFRALVEQSPISTQILSPDGRTILVNPAWEKFWRLNKESLQNYNILKDPQLIENGVMPYIQSGFDGHAIEIPAIPYNPENTPGIADAPRIPERWVSGFIFPIKDSEGYLREVIITHEDVTEKKYTEEAITNIAAGVSAKTGSAFFEQLILYLSKLFNTKYAFIGVIDENDNQKVNTLAVSKMGESVDNISYSLANTPCAEVIGKETCAYTRDVQKIFPEDLLLQQMEVESYIGTPLFDSEGRPLGLIVLLDDKPLQRLELIQEILQIFATRAGAELERINAEKELSLKDRAMEVAIEGILLIDASKDNKIIYANHAMEIISGYKRHELVNNNPGILYGSMTDKDTIDKLSKAIENEESCKVEMINYRKDEKSYWSEVTLTPVRDPVSNKVTHFISTAVDITERRNTEEALRRSQKMEAVGQLAGGVAHDFNNQLGIIIGYLDFLNDYVEGNDKPMQWVDTAMSATNRCIELTRQLLVFSRRKTKETEVTNINTELEKMDKLIARSVTPAINVETYLGTDLWPVNIDSGEFQDAILNLVINARDAMPDGGNLILETKNTFLDQNQLKQSPNLHEGEYVLISITDSGTGIDRETAEHVFDPFFTTKPEGKGTGLGLSMVYGFANRYGGDIKLYSEPGHGTTFKIYLPRSIDQHETKSSQKSSKSELPRGIETVLLVDDEADLLSLANDYLTSLGYSTITANSPEDALTLLNEHPEIDLLFSDVVMPGGMNGFELAERATELYPDLKILMTSGFTENTVAANGQLRFRENLLQKPYRISDLAKRIRLILDHNLASEFKTNESSQSPITIDNTLARTNSFIGKKVLVVDDDENVRRLYEINLTRLGCEIQTASDGDEAVSLFAKSHKNNGHIDAVILDLDLPGSMSGTEISEKMQAIDPEVIMIVSSGDSGGPIMTNFKDYGFSAALEKDFNREEISKILDGLF